MEVKGNSAGGHKWAVTGQEHEPTFDENGKKMVMHHVHFQTNTGSKGTVSLPDHEYSAVNVHGKINHLAGEMIKVDTMNSTTPPPEHVK